MTGGTTDLLDALTAGLPEAADAKAVRLVRCPGRINLIGEHTDYNEGFVLPMAIDREIVIGFIPTDDPRVEIRRLDTGDVARFQLGTTHEPSGTWVDYLAGMADVLARRGVAIRGGRGVIASSLPIEVGLSSSAAIEVAAAWALAAHDGPPLPPIELARAGQAVEHEFIGVNSGLMDQLAVILGTRDAALLIDCRSLEHRAIRLPLDDHVIVAVDSGSPRRLGFSAYNERRAECEAAVSAVGKRFPDIRALRDVDLGMLDSVRDTLSSAAQARAEHVIRESDRVLACVEALEHNDLEAVGELLAESHASLRDLFAVSSPQLDALVEIAATTPGVVGARMTGAGFGGSIVAIAERDAIDRLRRAVATEYPALTGLRATVHVVEPADGAGMVDDRP